MKTTLFFFLFFLSACTGALAEIRVFFTGHSFSGVGWMEILAKQAGVSDFVNLGRQALGGSRVVDHWHLPGEKNRARAALKKGGVDVLTLSPNMRMPDEGIDLFVDLALKHNPDIRILVQGSWMTWDGLGKDGITNAERDTCPVSEIRDRTARHMEDIRAQLRATNQRIGRKVCTLIPVGTAVVKLRERIAQGTLPGFKKPSQLFLDDIGHGKAPLSHLVNYMNCIALLDKDPRELPGLGTNGWRKEDGRPDPQLAAILKEIAWETMQEERQRAD